MIPPTKKLWQEAVARGDTEMSFAEWQGSLAKHSSAPWRAYPHPSDPRYRYVSSPEWAELARVVVATDDDDPSDPHQTRLDPVGLANLRLILKAPEMLAKLKVLNRILYGMDDAAYAAELVNFIREIDPTY